MSWILIITLIVVGLLFLLLEILVIPGTTVAAIIGSALIIFSVYHAYHTHGVMSGHITVGATAIGTILLLVFALRSKTWKKLMLESEVQSIVSQLEEKNIVVGDTGKSISRLAPSGKARINNEIYEVFTNGSFVDPGQEIEVIKILHNKVIVKLKK